jgi:hypothetical protein
MRLVKLSAAVASLLGFALQASAQNDTTRQDPLAFANPNYNLTTIEIEYTVPTGCGPADNVTTVRERVSYLVIYGTEEDILRDRVTQGQPARLARRELLKAEPDLTKRALSHRLTDRRWPSAVLPYSWNNTDVSAWLSDSEKEQRKQTFRDAAKVWMDRLPWMKIEERTDPYDMKSASPPDRITVNFTEGSVSWSPVGKAS